MFLFSGNLLLLLLKESCGLVQPAGRDDATVCVTNANLVVTELRDCKEMHVEMSDCLTCDVSDESLSLSPYRFLKICFSSDAS